MDKRELTKIMVEEASVEILESKSEHFLARATVSFGLLETKGWTIAYSKFEKQTYHVLPPRKIKYLFVYLDDTELFSSLIGKISYAYENNKPT